MGLLNKLGIAIGGHASRDAARSLPHGRNASHGHVGTVVAGTHREPEMRETTRVSNGLKEFLWNLEGLGRGTLLDLGPAWQTTLSFFIERGFRVTSDDVLRSWAEFQSKEAARSKEELTAEDYAQRTPETLAKKFLDENLDYASASFDAMLLWDLLDYLEPTLAKHLVGRLTEMLRPGGVVLAMFHSKKPESFQRYRVMDTSTVQVLGSKVIVPAQRLYQNREIQELFGRFRTVKSYVGRDQLRETLFIK
ncbi:MAG: class I SAM-dependent methyltransferase [Candidatus Acidiferrum sp.]